MKLATGLIAGSLAGIIAAASTNTAYAQEAPPPPPPTQETVVTTTSSGPNAAVVGTGLVLFGGTYLASVIVAAESSHSGDDHLYIPVVGPWLDLGDRNCGTNDPSCGNEGLNKAMLITDGILQGVGVVTAVAGLFIPETKITAGATTVGTVKVTPMELGRGGAGVGALGTF